MTQTSGDFVGTERFGIRRRLGAGGMGVVYEALDRDTNKLVALKVLSRSEPSLITRFKNEFRSLADVSHPNLVSLYELMSDGQYWFFTMELVEGVNFLEYVRPGYRTKQLPSSKTPTILKSSGENISTETADDAETQHLQTTQPASGDQGGHEFLESSPTTLDLNRLKNALGQLAGGLNALHQNRKLHRDIKPSNVLVTQDGRVVILDFGLVAEVEGIGVHESINLVGTPEYMSPEQCAQLPVSRSSDWYSVGVMLYQALYGKLPFSGKFLQVMASKQSIDPSTPNSVGSQLPRELIDLCKSLMRRNPEQRPSGRDVLELLQQDDTVELPKLLPPTSSSAMQITPFVGRKQYLDELYDAFEATTGGLTVTVYVHGSSGMGKSALLRHYLTKLKATRAGVVILEGRCYEREAVPYKALDGVIDSLTKYLSQLPRGKAEALMPRDVLALAKLFPVLLQVNCIAETPQRERDTAEPFALRRRGFAALQEMLGRISDRQHLVLCIDDLQWSDADSTSLLEDLLRPPGAPPLLLIASLRSEDIESRPFLKSLPTKTTSVISRAINVTPLDKEEAAQLVRELWRSDVRESMVDSIVSEARGNPFLLEQLARYVLTNDQTTTTGISLAVMLDARLGLLPEGARQFLDTLAIAGRPVNPEIVLQANGFSGDGSSLVSSLRANHFLRSGGSDHTVELYHDRIRESLASRQGADTIKQTYLRLAQVIERRETDDPDALFEYYLGAGETARAAGFAALAARKAASALAFDRAAALYRRALELLHDKNEVLTLKQALAEALVNAGRPAEAAETYLQLAKATSANRSLDFKRRAAEQLLRGGHLKEGLELTRSILTAIGFPFPRSQRRALVSLVLKRIRIRLRGLDFVERDASQISEAELFRIDMCWAIAAGLGAVDLIRGADFHCRHLLLALEAGEPSRVARAIAFETAQSVAPGGKSRERGRQLVERAQELAQRVGQPHALGLSIWADGIAAYLAGQWKKGAERCERAAEILRDQCTGVAWELAMAQRFMLSSLLHLGEVREVALRVPGLLATALEQGNVFFATELRTRMNLIWLAEDSPERARAEVVEALKAWPQEGFHLQHYSAMLALSQIELYVGDSEAAWKCVHGQWQPLKQSMLLHNQVLRIEAWHLLGRTALGSVASPLLKAAERDSRLQTAELMAQRIAKEKTMWANGYVSLLRAGIAKQRGNSTGAVKFLKQALEDFERANMNLYGAASRRCLGELIGGESGQGLISEAEAWMERQRIKNPAAMTRMLAPGLVL